MPPKKATPRAAAAKAAPAKSSTTTKAPTTKRKASEDSSPEPAPPKRGRPAKTQAAAVPAPKPTRTRAKTSPKAAPKATTKAAPKAAPKAASKATTKAPAKSTAMKTANAAPAANTSAKRKASDAASDDTEAPAAKKSRTSKDDAPTTTMERPIKAAVGPAARKASTVKKLSINSAPTERLDVFVMGEGESGELGLGTAKKAVGVKRPRLNPFLDSKMVGVVQIATGGMHAAALTHDGLIYTWGVNDQGALGRDTAWEGGLRDMDDTKSNSSDDSDVDDNGLNPNEATPSAIPSASFPEGTKFVQIVAGDSSTFALTDDGLVWGWGTFRDNQGVLGFTKDVREQMKPALLVGLKKIKQLACGANHVLALDVNGSVFAWGTGQQNQLGRRVVERTRIAGLTPREFGLPKKQIKYIAAGSDHSFAVDTKDNVWSWGLNNFGQTGIPDGAGGDEAIVPTPQIVDSLDAYSMTCLKGGRHHSVGVSANGECLVWGRADGSQIGIMTSELPEEDVIMNEHNRPAILNRPTPLKGINAKFVTAESDHSILITTDGQAYSWGLSSTYQTGLGVDTDIEVPTLIDNTAVRGKQLSWAGCGGQFSMLAGIADAPVTNGEAKKDEVKAPAAKPVAKGKATPKDKKEAVQASENGEGEQTELPNGHVELTV